MPKKGQGTKSVPKTKTNHKANKNKQSKAVSSKLPSVFSLAKSSWQILWRNKNSMSFIILIYGLVYLVLVLGISSPGNVPSLKHEFSGVFHGHLSSLFRPKYLYLSGWLIYFQSIGIGQHLPSLHNVNRQPSHHMGSQAVLPWRKNKSQRQLL